MAELYPYRAYFLSSSDHIRYVRAVKAPDHLSAKAQVEVMLQQSEYAAVEIYEGWRLISRMDRVQQAA
jgi:acyl-coenzyme A thioesterase PaaI-like protein